MNFFTARPRSGSYSRLWLGKLLLGLAICSAPLISTAQLLPGRQAQTGTAFDLAKLNDPADVLVKLEQFQASKDYPKQVDALKRLLELRPYAGGLRYELARVYALMDDKSLAYDTLINLQQAGQDYDPSGDPDFKKIEGTGAYGYIVKNLQENGKPFGVGKVSATIQAEQAMIESIAYDPNKKRFLVGSLKTGEVLAVDAAGKTTTLIKPDATNKLFGVFAMAVDAKNNKLYVTSTSLPSFVDFDQASLGQGGLYQFELSSGKFLKRFNAPFDGGFHLFAGLTVAPSGEVYLIDPPTRAVYQLRGDALKPLFQAADLVSLRGITVSDNHKFLYLSDFEMGLFIVDLEHNQIATLDKKGQNLGGIESLQFWNGHLIAVQNGFSPKRVMRVALNPDLRSIRIMQPIEANKPALSSPTVSALVGKQIYILANSQREAYDQNGKIVAGAQPQKRVIYQAAVDYKLGEELKLPDWARKYQKPQ